MDDSGNILIKRIAKANVFVKIPDSENAVSNEIVKIPNGSLELDKPVKLFDMKKFQHNVARELNRAYPDRRKLECQVTKQKYFASNQNSQLFSVFLPWHLSKMNLISWSSRAGSC